MTNTRKVSLKQFLDVPLQDSTVASLNTLLSMTSNNRITDFRSFLKDISTLAEDTLSENDELKTTVNNLHEELNARKAISTSGSVHTYEGNLTYEVEYKEVRDLFQGLFKKTSFKVPTLVWKDSKGNVVRHPETPGVDKNYEFNVTNLTLFLTSVNTGMNSWLFGHTGTGKSTFVEQVAARIGYPVSRINLDSDMTKADLVGATGLKEKNGATVSNYVEGILPRAMQRPGFLLMDEIDAGRPEILFVIQRALEGNGLLLTEDDSGDRVVKPHALFRFVATANTRGQGDEYGMYQGTRSMNAAMLDRFTVFLEFDYLDTKQERDLVRKLVPTLSDDLATKMCKFAKEIREAFAKGEIYTTITPRGLKVMAELYTQFTDMKIDSARALEMAMNTTVLNKATADTRTRYSEIASRVFGSTV